MKLQPDSVEKPFVKFGRVLDGLPSDPSPEEVHSLRTQARRLEASIDALSLRHDKTARRLLTAITPIRKAAGSVRDMDVLIEVLLTLRDGFHEGSLVHLVEHLAAARHKKAAKLGEVVELRRKEARRRLKSISKVLKKIEVSEGPSRGGETAVQILITEINHWPALDEQNLHAFRIRLTELRYVLLLSPDSDRTMIGQLGKTKDAIGEWHDWTALLKIARKVLDSKSDRKTVDRLKAIQRDKFKLALTLANGTRKRYSR